MDRPQWVCRNILSAVDENCHSVHSTSLHTERFTNTDGDMLNLKSLQSNICHPIRLCKYSSYISSLLKCALS